ncbi:MAG TPA: PDZ domain-containing protein, partial [bacterium]|nr:PDZ domain-containing protein [bacterium]
MPDRGIKITHVAPSGPAQKAGIRPGDVLESINTHPVRDILDVRFYSTQDRLHCRFYRGSNPIEIDLSGEADWGLEFEPMRFHACGNRCIFCFVDQNP